MITTIPDRERDLQAQVDALTEELERLRAQEPVALKSVHLIRDVQGMCAVLVNGRMAIRDNGDIIDHFATLDWFAAPPSQPAEPTIDEQVASVNAVFDAWRNGEDATLTLGLAAQPAHPDEFACPLCFDDPANIKPAEPVQRPGWVSVPVCLTPEMREVLLMADRFTVGEVYIMLLAAAPKDAP